MQTEVTYKEDFSADDEILIQNELKKCKNSFQRKDIVLKKLLTGKYKKVDEFEYNGQVYNLQSHNSVDNKIKKKGSEIYVPVFVLNFQKLQLTFSPGWFVDKDSALNKLQSIDFFRCSLMNSELTVLKESNFISNYINKIFSDKKELINNLDLFLLWSIPTLMYLLLFILFGISSEGDLTPIIISSILGLIPVLLIYGIRKNLNVNIEKFYKIENINIDDSYDYNIINANVSITPTEVKLYSNELDCTWIFEKDDMHVLPDECIHLLNNTDSDNNIIISVSESISEDSIIKSEDGKWWIESFD